MNYDYWLYIFGDNVVDVISIVNSRFKKKITENRLIFNNHTESRVNKYHGKDILWQH